MSHDLEVHNGTTSFASLRKPAWHNLGQIADEEMTTEEIMALANLNNWQVRAVGFDEFLADTPVSDSTGKQLIVRNRPGATEEDDKRFDVLGVVGGRYGIVQNEELFDFGTALLGENARWETAGSLKKGTTVFGTLALEMETVIDENGVADKVNNYLMLSTTHDGSGPMFAGITPVRVVCANTYNVVLRGGLSNQVKIRHTRNVQQRMSEAARVMEYSVKYTESFAETASKLFETKVSDREFEALVTSFYADQAESESAAGITRWEKKLNNLMDLWTGPTQQGIRGTAWGAFGALTEDAQWNRQIQAAKPENYFAAGAGFDNAANIQRQKMLNLVNAFADA